MAENRFEAIYEEEKAKAEHLANLEKHLAHPFYKRVDEVTDEVKIEQILKGANKYDEPFNPDSWTNKELVWHQLQELRDAQVYSVGLLDRLEKQEQAFIDLIKDYEIALNQVEYWRLRAMKSGKEAASLQNTLAEISSKND